MSPLIRWAALSVFSFGFVISLTWLLGILGASERLSFGLALASSLCVNTAACRYFVFAGPQRAGPVKQLAQYAMTSGTSRVLEFAAYWMLLDVLHLNHLVIATMVMLTASVLKYLACKLVIFNPA
jgi:putative flippase GtrA